MGYRSRGVSLQLEFPGVRWCDHLNKPRGCQEKKFQETKQFPQRHSSGEGDSQGKVFWHWAQSLRAVEEGGQTVLEGFCCMAQGTRKAKCVGFVRLFYHPMSFSQEKAIRCEPQKYLRLEARLCQKRNGIRCRISKEVPRAGLGNHPMPVPPRSLWNQ